MRKPLLGFVWWCGDEWCDCYQPQIAMRNLPRYPGGIGVVVWGGTFRTGGQWREANNELNRTAQTMRRKCHALYQQVEWPWERDV